MATKDPDAQPFLKRLHERMDKCVGDNTVDRSTSTRSAAGLFSRCRSRKIAGQVCWMRLLILSAPIGCRVGIRHSQVEVRFQVTDHLDDVQVSQASWH